ncbi:MAG: glycosyltransferase family 9 protein, partial [Planctomycetes bacterium]|nr:glycosyltransferase family 9 protein [Planctomycetota bacterium]
VSGNCHPSHHWYGADCDCSTKPSGPHAPVMVGKHLPRSPGAFIPMPMVHYYADLVESIGCERPGDRLELFTTPDDDTTVEARLRTMGIADKHPLVVLSPGAKFGASKCWPPDRFSAAANRLVEEDDAAIVITCGPGEESIAREIGRATHRDSHVLDAPLLTLGQLKSLIQRCDLLICNDAGPRHFAKALNVPVVTIFGPTHPDWTATSHENERIVRVNIDCGPCQQKICPLGHHRCMTDVTVDMVVEAARDLLASRRPASAAR